MNYILTTQTESELYHYGVPGMKWGKRKAYKYENKANISRASAKEWEQKAKIAKAKGKRLKSAQYEENAKLEREKAAIFDQKSKGLYSKRANKYNEKSSIANESAKEWAEMAKDAKNKGKLAKATKYSQYAEADRQAAQYYSQKSKKIIDNRIKRRQLASAVGTKTKQRGKEITDRLKNKISG